MNTKYQVIYVLFIFYSMQLECFFQHKHIISINRPLDGLKVLKQLEQRKSIVSIIKDIDGTQYCVKQVKRPISRAQCSLLREVLASCVAESLHIPVNYVRVIPSSHEFPGKIYNDRIALLSIFMPGKPINEIEKYAGRSIKQWWSKELVISECGLTRSVIRNMAIHPDLCVISAFDTFVSNTDRCSHNLFYDQLSNRFFGIDQEIAFKLPYEKNLSAIACLQIRKFLNDSSFHLNKAEFYGLKLYNSTLKKLVAKNPPEKLHNFLDELIANVELGRFFSASDSFSLKQIIEKYKHKIVLQYQKALELIELINILIKHP